MKITIFKNKKGLIHGSDAKRIECDRGGVLKIGSTEIAVKAEESCVMPLLFYGATGSYGAKFVTSDGVYTLADVTVRNGLILPPPATAVEIMELHCLLDEANEKADRLQKKVTELENIFDTDSLNFIIK